MFSSLLSGDQVFMSQQQSPGTILRPSAPLVYFWKTPALSQTCVSLHAVVPHLWHVAHLASLLHSLGKPESLKIWLKYLPSTKSSRLPLCG